MAKESFHDILESIRKENASIHIAPAVNNEDLYLPIVESLATEIICQRDAHFSGSFAIMLGYYAEDGRGVSDDIDIEDIELMALQEKRLGQNIAPLVLSGSDMEHIARSRTAYRKLKELYEIAENKNSIPLLVANLILAEEDDLTEAIDVVVAQGEDIVPSLIDLLQSDDFFDPLFPGYGQAPLLAAHCLGAIGSKNAIKPLFEAMGFVSNFFDEEQLINALHLIGAPAKEFLLNIIKSSPPTKDNELAAIAIASFKEDPNIPLVCLEQLQDDKVCQHPCAKTLALICEDLKDEVSQKTFIEISQKANIPSSLLEEMSFVIKLWH